MFFCFFQDTENVAVRKKPGPKPKKLLPGYFPQRGRPPKDSIPLKKRLHSLTKYMLDFTVSIPTLIYNKSFLE